MQREKRKVTETEINEWGVYLKFNLILFNSASLVVALYSTGVLSAEMYGLLTEANLSHFSL